MADRSERTTLKRLGFVALIACGVALGVLGGRWWSPAPQLAAARQRWAADAAAVDANLTALEDRLLATQARVRLWDELRTRHESVSQVACQNLGEHARAIFAAAERAKEQARGRKQRLASASAGSGDERF